MEYAVFSDESCVDSHRYMLIGGLWVPRADVAVLREGLNAVRLKHGLRAEMKWTKVSQTMLIPYMDFVGTFFNLPRARFRCLVLDTQVIDYKTYHFGDKELGFYKFYYLLVSRNLARDSANWLYVDHRNLEKLYRLDALKETVNAWCRQYRGDARLVSVEPLDSKKDDIIQVTDIILGAVGRCWNQDKSTGGKADLCTYIRQRAGVSLGSQTKRRDAKLSIWKWEPSKP